MSMFHEGEHVSNFNLQLERSVWLEATQDNNQFLNCFLPFRNDLFVSGNFRKDDQLSLLTQTTFQNMGRIVSLVCPTTPQPFWLSLWFPNAFNSSPPSYWFHPLLKMLFFWHTREDGSNIGGSGIHFPSAPGKYLADLRSRANSQQYSSIYED